MDASSRSSSFESSSAFVPDFGGDGDRPVEHSPRGRYIRFDVRLGTGAYKTVFKAYDTDQGIDVAWNAIDIGQLPATEKTRIIQEVQLLQKLEHKNIINFYGSWFSKEKNQVVFITEIMTSGTLKSYIKRVQFIKWKIIRRWCVQILEGLHYLHSQSPPVIHRDLKCDNIFINGNTGDLRIGDLGLSTQLAVHTRTKAQSVLGTPEFMAPELYDESYDEKVDIYAFGMCVLEMVTKEVPYSECVNPAQIYKKVTAGIRPKGLQRVVSAPARDFIELCLSRGNGEIDVTTEYLLNHDFLKAQDDDGDMVECLTEDEADIKARDMARHDSLNDASMQDIDNEDCERPDDTSEEKVDGAVPQSSSSGADDTNVEDPSDSSARPVAVSATSNSEDGSLNPADVAVAAVAAQQHNEMEQESSAVETIEEEGEEGPIANDNRGADEGVENFLRDLPGSEIGIHNNRMNVMGGRGQRLELENVSEEDDSPPLSAESDNTMTSSSVAPPAESPVTVERGTKPRKRHDIKSCKDPHNEHSILLSLRIIIEGKSKEIKFSFNLFTDSTHEVACELAADVGILEPDLEDIADSIAFLVTEGKIANLPDVEEDVWEEAPEPHAFLAKPLPPVAQMKFVMTAPEESPFPAGNASGNEVPRSPLPSPPHAKETYAEEMNHPSLEDRSRGMSLGSMIDNDAYKELMMSTPLPTSVQTEDLVFDSSEEEEHDIGDATLDEAIRNEEEKHQKEVERFRKKMQEFEEKKRRMVTRQGGKMEGLEEAPKEGGGYPHSAQSSPGRPLASKTL